MTISAETAKLIYNAITYTTAQAYMNLLDHSITLDENGNPTEATIQCIQDTAKQMMIDFCEEADIDKVELDDDEDYDIPDDVDETNYDPFLGQDMYE